jgi:hypothetical protein
MHNGKPNPLCPIGGNIQCVIGGIYDEVVHAVDRQLGLTTIAAVLEAIHAKVTS